MNYKIWPFYCNTSVQMKSHPDLQSDNPPWNHKNLIVAINISIYGISGKHILTVGEANLKKGAENENGKYYRVSQKS